MVPIVDVFLCVEYDTEYGRPENREFACVIAKALIVPMNPERIFSGGKIASVYEEIRRRHLEVFPLEENVEALKEIGDRYAEVGEALKGCGNDADCWEERGLYLVVVDKDVLFRMNLEVTEGKLMLIEEWYNTSEINA